MSKVKSRRVFLLILMIGSMVLGGFTWALQNPIEIAKLEVNIWPEYDRPETLVIYRLTLTGGTKLPAQISLRIPSAAGAPYNVAFKDLDGLLYDIEYTLIPEGEWNRLVFITPSPDVQVEYYDPNITIVGDKHTINYRWIGDYTVDNLTVIVQQPKDAYNLTINPELGLGVINPDDHLVYYSHSFGTIDAGIAFDLTLSYQKDTDTLSATSVSVKAAGPLPIKRTFKDQFLALVVPIAQNQGLVVLAILVLAWLVLFILATALSGSRFFDRFKSKKKLVLRSGETAKQENAPIYCYNCGKQAHPGDVYCRVCGAKLHNP